MINTCLGLNSTMDTYFEHAVEAAARRLHSKELSEDAFLDIIKALTPDPIKHGVKRLLHGNQYKSAKIIYDALLADKKRGYTPESALARAAIAVGLSPRELNKVWAKDAKGDTDKYLGAKHDVYKNA